MNKSIKMIEILMSSDRDVRILCFVYMESDVVVTNKSYFTLKGPASKGYTKVTKSFSNIHRYCIY